MQLSKFYINKRRNNKRIVGKKTELLYYLRVAINITSFTLDISLGLDDIGISGSIKNGDTTNAFGISADISQFKVGFEASSTVKWDESTDVTSYTNASITGWGIAAVYIFATTGQWVSSPQHQPAFR